MMIIAFCFRNFRHASDGSRGAVVRISQVILAA